MSITKNKNFWIILVIILIIAAVLYFQRSDISGLFSNNKQSKEGNPDSTKAFLSLDFGRGKKRVFEGGIGEDMSILDALLYSSNVGRLGVRYVLSDKTKILSIGGQPDNLFGKWTFYLNGKQIKTENIHKTKVKDNDRIDLKFESFVK